MPRCPRVLFAPALACLLLLGVTDALAHKERPIVSPIRPGPVPDPARVNPTSIVVCKASSKPTRADLDDIRQRLHTATGDELTEARADLAAWIRNKRLFRKCRYEHIQEAVNAAGDNTDIKVLPGIYREEPSRAAPTSGSGDLPDGSYSFAYHVAHPNDANLIAILGKANVTLEGTGARPTDVLIDAGFVKDVGVRADQCTGFIVRNLWQRDANEHGIYVVDSDGYVFDRTVGSFNGEYSLFSFGSDNGLYQDCEAVGGGDSGLYIGGHPDTSSVARFSSEVRRCKVHHNPLGFSGTQGNSVWMHDNDYYDNAIGISFDSENDHPNFPQRQSLIENNLLHDNNFDVYAATSDVPARGPGYDFFRYPVGTAMWIVGGDDNTIRNNRVWNNGRFGFILAANAFEAPLLAKVNRNQYTGNIFGVAPDGSPAPNGTALPPGGAYAPGGTDFFWDQTGLNNCWGPQDPTSGPFTSAPTPIPGPCPNMNGVDTVIPPLGGPLEILLSCSLVQVPMSNPPVFVTQDSFFPCPWGHTNDAPYQNRDEAECGNGSIDPLDVETLAGGGEDCDTGAGYGGGTLSETCDSLGHGPGTLACTNFCTFDTSACAAAECSEYGVSRLRFRNLDGAPGDEAVTFSGMDLPGTGHTFDPRTEETSFVVRDEGGLVHNAVIPASDPHWSARPPAAPTSFTYEDAAGTNGGIVQITLAAPAGFAVKFSANVKLRATDLSGAADARTATAVLRVGNDCWSETTPCAQRAGRATCRGRAVP